MAFNREHINALSGFFDLLEDFDSEDVVVNEAYITVHGKLFFIQLSTIDKKTGEQEYVIKELAEIPANLLS